MNKKQIEEEEKKKIWRRRRRKSRTHDHNLTRINPNVLWQKTSTWIFSSTSDFHHLQLEA